MLVIGSLTTTGSGRIQWTTRFFRQISSQTAHLSISSWENTDNCNRREKARAYPPELAAQLNLWTSQGWSSSALPPHYWCGNSAISQHYHHKSGCICLFLESPRGAGCIPRSDRVEVSWSWSIFILFCTTIRNGDCQRKNYGSSQHYTSFWTLSSSELGSSEPPDSPSTPDTTDYSSYRIVIESWCRSWLTRQPETTQASRTPVDYHM